ncbi:CubicO group peptidase, beta-lactamase class C family [Mycolicibacterium rutilum]|uniref:CubicO group peptidase, beta-lactamase class C family n=1 Tax=Mycolicibacterium rutilum TaxID=370526 RepID=A0A1H6LWU2_MYCRU|nr:serine hydrolase domain-containing protein [Mycolicibacterium rutilum]SEH89349.1 CubicO group peptidase, beta-lactamase class C family [Mycolicibacterium rutilum]
MSKLDLSARAAAVLGVLVLALTSCGNPPPPPPSSQTPAPVSAAPVPRAAPTPDIPEISRLINDAIAANRLPGAVVAVGHAGRVVFQRAYGVRKLAGEQDLDGAPGPAEPMTEDTVFDIASLTKPLATATAVMQLSERVTVSVDEPLQTYLPAFNPSNDPQRARVTVRMLLTHTSGLPGDLDLRDPWGLEHADKAEGVRRALTTPLQSNPGAVFRYSDIGYVLLGALVETLTGEAEDVYVQRAVFAPIGMTDTRYLPPAKACGPHEIRGAAIAWAPGRAPAACPAGTWSTDLLPHIAPTARDEESRADPGRNPDIDHLLRGTVHDPTARRMGGVVGHAGVFSTVADLNLFAQALLDRLAGRRSTFPLERSTVQLMTSPQQPDGPDLRGLGWDIDTAHSRPRGTIFPVGTSFGHTGFTGTSLWIDPASDSYVVLLTNVIHLRGSRPVSDLQGDVATAAARALHLPGG